MDQRRCYGLRAPRPIGYSTYMVPQLENYTLFASPYVDLNKKLGKLLKGFKQDVTAQSETDSKVEIKQSAPVEQKELKRPDEEDAKMLPGDTSDVDSAFGIVLNVATVEPENLKITFGKGNVIEVRVDQKSAKLSRMEIHFSRNCSYKYQLPDGVDKKSLVALRTSDDYLIILPKSVLREDLFKKAIKTLAPSTDDSGVTREETKTVDIEGEKSKPKVSDPQDTAARKGSDPQDTTSRKGSDPQDIVTKKRPVSKVKRSDSDESESKRSKLEEVEDSSGSVLSENSLVPVQVSRLLRPGMDIFILRKYMVDFESYVSTVRNFIENASFITENSKTPELKLRDLATEETDKYLEKPHIKKLDKQESSESGISSFTPDASEKSEEMTPDISDESSRSSTVKSEEHSLDTPDE